MEPQPRELSRRHASALLLAAICLHNLEEAIAYPIVRPKAAELARSLEPRLQLPDAGAFQAALLLLTLAVAGMLLWTAKTRRDGPAWLAIRATALVLLANVLIPHVPAALALGGYAPGVATAVALNLPIGLWVLMRAPARS